MKYYSILTLLACHFVAHAAQIEMSDIDTPVDNEGHTELYWAAYEGNSDKVLTLLEQGADVNKASNEKLTPLHCASYYGFLEIAAALLDYRADVNAQNYKGVTPLIIAAQQGNYLMIQLLIDRKADIRKATNEGASPLFYAAQGAHTDIATLLIDRGAPLETTGPLGATPLCVAAEAGHIDVVRLLLDRGTNIDAATKEGATALYLAVQHTHCSTAQLLIQRDAQLNIALHRGGSTPLCAAIFESSPSLVYMLLAGGALDFSLCSYGFFEDNASCWTKKLLLKATDPDKQRALRTILHLLTLFGLNDSPPKAQFTFEDDLRIILNVPPHHGIDYKHVSNPLKKDDSLCCQHFIQEDPIYQRFALEDSTISITPLSFMELFLSEKRPPAQRERALKIHKIFADTIAHRKLFQHMLTPKPGPGATIDDAVFIQQWNNVPVEIRAMILSHMLTPPDCLQQFRDMIALRALFVEHPKETKL